MPPPKFSIVIPAYAYPAGLDRLLAALTRQMDPPCFEVLVLDDGSPTSLGPVTLPYRHTLNLRYIRLTNGGPARARNHGVRDAAGEWIAFTDHDCEPDANWLAQLSRQSDRTSTSALGGSRVTGLPANDWSVAHDLLCTFATRWHPHEEAHYISTENMAVPRALFLRCGGFDERFHYAQEDREFCARWRASGLPMQRVPSAIVKHSHAFTPASFCRQHVRYGEGATEYHEISTGAGPGWTLGMRLRFYSGLLASPFRAFRGMQALRISAILALSQTCYAWGYYRSRLALRNR